MQSLSFLLKIHKDLLQFYEISEGHFYKVSRQKGHLKVTDKRKSTYRKSVSAWFSVWAIQGLNLGPPDYESVALTNWAKSPTPTVFAVIASAKVLKFGQTAKFFVENVY